MYSLKTLFISLVLLSFAFVANGQERYAQAADSVIIDVKPERYPEFLNIHNLKKYANVTYIGVDSSSTNLSNYLLQIAGSNLTLKALYGKDGNLIKGLLIKEDTPLPGRIYHSLKSSHEAGWTMTGNKTVVVDFNPTRAQYMVTMQKDKQKKDIFFNSYGTRIKGFTDLPRFDGYNNSSLALAQ